jgi:hypothetical protein
MKARRPHIRSLKDAHAFSIHNLAYRERSVEVCGGWDSASIKGVHAFQRRFCAESRHHCQRFSLDGQSALCARDANAGLDWLCARAAIGSWV